MITFDIKDFYVNIPIDKTLKIVKSKLLENNNTQITQQVLSPLKVTLSQNLSTRTRRFNGIPDFKLNSRNIFWTLRRHAYKTTPWHKKTKNGHKTLKSPWCVYCITGNCAEDYFVSGLLLLSRISQRWTNKNTKWSNVWNIIVTVLSRRLRDVISHII